MHLSMIEQVRLSDIVDGPYQPRSSLGDVTALARSIQAVGLAHPPVGRWADGELQLALGRRRVAAIRHLAAAGSWPTDTVPVDVRELSDGEMCCLGLAENTARADLDPLEQLLGWQMALDVPGVDRRDVAEIAGISLGTLTQYLQILRLPRHVLEHLSTGRLKYDTALHLVHLVCDRPGAQESIADALHYCLEGDGRLTRPIVRRRIEHLIATDARWALLDAGDGASFELYCVHRMRGKSRYFTCEGLNLHTAGRLTPDQLETMPKMDHPFGHHLKCETCDAWRIGWAAGQSRVMREIADSVKHPRDCECSPCRLIRQVSIPTVVRGTRPEIVEKPNLDEYITPSKQTYPRTCRQCGIDYRGTAMSKFCSHACSLAAHKSRHSVLHTCRNCKAEFHAPPDRNRKYCSRSCAARAKKPRKQHIDA